MLGTALNPIRISSDVDDNLSSTYETSPRVSELKVSAEDGNRRAGGTSSGSVGGGDRDMGVNHGSRGFEPHLDGMEQGFAPNSDVKVPLDRGNTSGTGGDARGATLLAPFNHSSAGQRFSSAMSSPSSSLSDLPEDVPPPAAESSKTAAARAQQSKPKATPKRKANGTSAIAKSKAPKLSYPEDGDEDFSFLSAPYAVYDDDDDGDYRPSGKKAKSTPKRKANGGSAGGSAKRKLPKVEQSMDLDDDIRHLGSGHGKTVNGETVESHPDGKTPRKARATNPDKQYKLLLGRTTELQMGKCQRPRYADRGKCVQCIAKAGGDSCRFSDLRTFPIDPDTGEITGPGYFEDSTLREPMTEMPGDYNTAESTGAVEQTELTVAPILLPVLFTELRHVVKYNAIHREVDVAKHRALCDFCHSTIFAGYWFCKTCGRDYCLQCEHYFSDSETSMESSPWPLRAEARPRLQRCNVARYHFRGDLQSVSRFGRDELEAHCAALLELVLRMEMSIQEKLRVIGLSEDESLADDVRHLRSKTRQNHPIVPPPFHLDTLYTKCTDRHFTLPPDPAELQAHSHPFMCVSVNDLDNSGFEQIWSRGEPIAVTDVGERLQMQWTPDTIIEMFGTEPCVLVNCQTDASILSTVEKFFTSFKDIESRGAAIWKLKDWPTTEDFKLTHPGLYNDFCDALPVPDYTRREGILNLYSHFPGGPTKPDIGPKMYNAFAARETPGGFGSTRLHMDVADAINLMLYASPRADGLPGCAVWDLFRAEDADKIRQFLFDKFGQKHAFTDPIHAQLFYLNSDLRRQLWEGYGVTSFRIYQYPGQCVFIPAGCAHQVCNLADCIKIALDFVSPHNVSRCQRLTSDFRNENFAKAWKEDVLQLYNVLWYSWLWTREARQRLLVTVPARGDNVEIVSSMPTAGTQGAINADLSRQILEHAVSRPDPPPPDEVRNSAAMKWPSSRGLAKGGSGAMKRANRSTSAGESQSPMVKRATGSTAEVVPVGEATPPPPLPAVESQDGVAETLLANDAPNGLALPSATAFIQPITEPKQEAKHGEDEEEVEEVEEIEETGHYHNVPLEPSEWIAPATEVGKNRSLPFVLNGLSDPIV